MPKLKPIEDLTPRVSMLFYGFPGSGKTYLARSLLGHPDLYPALVAVCDNGELTLRDVICPDLTAVRADFSVLEDIFEILTTKGNRYKSLFIDNLTVLHQTALFNRAAISSANKVERSKYELTQNDYGVARNQMLAVIGAFAMRPELATVNFFATCLGTPTQDEATGNRLIEPTLAGKLMTEVPAYFDVVGYLETITPRAIDIKKAQADGKVLKSYRKLTVNQTSVIPIARNRGNVLGDEVINPSLPELVLKVKAVGK